MKLISCLLGAVVVSAQSVFGGLVDELREVSGLAHVAQLLQHSHQQPQQLVHALQSAFRMAPSVSMSELGLGSEVEDDEDIDSDVNAQASASLPIVFTHGMGDSCFNKGMASLPTFAAQYFSTYSVCIPGGDDLISDTLSAFLTTMDANIEVFAQKVQNDTKLKNGFYAVGLSQGNLVLRGYMHKYNNPPLVKALHIHGTLMGVGAFPRCPLESSEICVAFANLLGGIAYNPLVQSILFQANYFREPEYTNSTAYKTNSQIAQWNGEGVEDYNPDFKTNFLKTQSITAIKALKDTMIDPKESEWWGTFAPGSTTNVLSMKQTDWYVKDTFGLKTLDQAGRLAFNTSTGDHLRFNTADLSSWMLQAGFAQ